MLSGHNNAPLTAVVFINLKYPQNGTTVCKSAQPFLGQLFATIVQVVSLCTGTSVKEGKEGKGHLVGKHIGILIIYRLVCVARRQ